MKDLSRTAGTGPSVMETTGGWCAEREIRRRLPRTEEKSNRVALPDTCSDAGD